MSINEISFKHMLWNIFWK